VRNEKVTEAVSELGDRVIGILEASAETGQGLEELRSGLVNALMRSQEKPWENFE